jgi:hypothetical protein
MAVTSDAGPDAGPPRPDWVAVSFRHGKAGTFAGRAKVEGRGPGGGVRVRPEGWSRSITIADDEIIQEIGRP